VQFNLPHDSWRFGQEKHQQIERRTPSASDALLRRHGAAGAGLNRE
jgi:hypothetical protein